MRTILIKIDTSYVVKNFLRTDAFRAVLNNPDVRMVFLAPEEKRDYYQSEFAHPRVIFMVAPETKKLLTERFYRFLEMASIHTRTVTMIDRTDFVRAKGQKNILTRVAVYGIRRICWNLGRFFWWHRIIRASYGLIPSHVYDNYFTEIQPDLVYCPSVIYDYNLLLREAKKKRIPTAGMITSWDNFYSKVLLRVWPDHLIVHTDGIKEQAMRCTGYPADRIVISGLPQYDDYFRKTGVIARDEFIRQIGGDPSKKLLVFAASGKSSISIDRALIELLSQGIREGDIHQKAQILLRPYPRYDVTPEKARAWENELNILVVPAMAHVGTSRDNWEFDRHAITLLLNTLAHADIVIALHTTFFIEAALFNRPLIAIGFDERNVSYWNSARRFFEWDHLRDLDALNGIWRVENRAELFGAINAYLENPALYEEGRKRIVKAQSQFTDGKSGERLARILLGILGK